MLKLYLPALALSSMIAALPLPVNPGAAAFLLPREYLQPQYSPGPPASADYVFISGERILLNLEISNESSEAIQLTSGEQRPEQLIDVVLLRSVGQSLQDVPVRLSPVAAIRLKGQGRSVEIPWTGAVDLSLRSSVVVPLEIVSEAASVPGIYELRIRRISAACLPDCGVRNHAGLFR